MIIPPRIPISPLTAVVLLHHVTKCDDADNDADRTVLEITQQIDNFRRSLPTALLESALYCCNMENERGNFWHPYGWSFDKFVVETINDEDLHFDRYYNVIYEKKRKTKTPKAAGLDNNP